MQNYTAVTNFLPLTLGNVGVFLGVKWLESLGDVKSNWKEHRMSFQQNGATIKLQGDPMLCNRPLSLKTLLKAIRDDGEGVIVECGGYRKQNGMRKKSFHRNWCQYWESIRESFKSHKDYPYLE
ncbi:hypothetical protein V5N11_028792 [Cardamine amara subsp. amara]|uniref:Uncharacterized protein n=1 Tax=Cardamine amara subsp. amara TaxID=228776 RepID=A0ABD1AZK6_CARAN